MSYSTLVNPLQGTDSIREFSTGNTLPLVARPWGTHHWTLQTGRSPWVFNRGLKRLQGVRLTHQPSPWMRDYSSLTLQPFTGPVSGCVEHQASAYRPEDAVLRPNYLRVELLRYGVTMEMTPTERGAAFLFRFPSGVVPKLAFYFDGAHALRREGAHHVTGVTQDHEGGVPDGYGLHFLGEFDVEVSKLVKTDEGGYLEFPQGTEQVELRLAGSFIGPEIAQVTLLRELQGKTFQEIENEGGRIWNGLLGRMEIDAVSAEQERTFYSCLYRCLLFPRFLDEVGEAGEILHCSPYDGKTHAGRMCADSGFWDTYRTLYPLLALVYPDILQGMIDGWMSACRQSGWSPKWSSPGLRDCMIGTHFDVFVADVVSKGLTGWDVSEAFEYLRQDANRESSDGCYGRAGLEDYIRLGYVPCDKYPYAVSSTLDYAYDDFCVAQVASYLGKDAEAAVLLQRSQNYRNVFDPGVGFMRGRLSGGDWVRPFREYEWGGAYIEGGPWQHAFNVPHDPDGLAELYGGRVPLCRKLDEMLARPPKFEVGHYGYEIHEATEMALAGFGQYAHSNQPVHGFLFDYALMGHPEKTAHWVRRVCRELYSPDDLPGDEDNGEMSAWYVWACLGLYPHCPGKPEYVCFEPMARSVKVHYVMNEKEVVFFSGETAGEAPRRNGDVIRHRDLFKSVLPV